jgi:filamentous hemagglutinin family protein
MISGLGSASPPTLLIAPTPNPQSVSSNQLPNGGSVVFGSATISTLSSPLNKNLPSTLSISQITNKVIINWNEFDIGSNASVNFNQPSVNAIALNRINSPNATQIFGNLNSNGQIYLLNSSGIYFAPSANINVGGIVATTGVMQDSEFMNGGTTFKTKGYKGATLGSVINNGSIKSGLGGYVALLAPEVVNNGVIVAKQGSIALIGAKGDITLNFSPFATLDSVTIKQELLNSLIQKHAAVKSTNGQIILSKKAVTELTGSVINSGTLDANGVTSSGGRIILTATSSINDAGTISANGSSLNNGGGGTISLVVDLNNTKGQLIVGGNLSAQGNGLGSNGGTIETSGSHVFIEPKTSISTHSINGKPGTWTIDPTDFTISSMGGDMSGATLSSNLATTNVVVLSTQGISGVPGASGNIFVNDAISWASNSSLTLNAQNNIYINSSITALGNSAKVNLQFGQSTVSAGNTSNYFLNSSINLQPGNNFSTQLGNNGLIINYNVINALGGVGSSSGQDLQGMNGALDSSFALGKNIDASITQGWNSGAGFTPIGTLASPFTGNFDGLGHSISGLSISQLGIANIGFIGATVGKNSIQNIGLIGGATLGGAGTGGLIGNSNSSLIKNSYNTGNVTGGAGTGGLVGSSISGNITRSYSTGTITGAAGTGGIEGSLTTGEISSSYATGSVSGGAGTGGLIGSMTSGTVLNSYASGNTNGAAGTGGLVGSLTSGTVSNSYAIGNVAGAAGTGGLIGTITSGAITDSYSAGSVTGDAGTGSLVGASSGAINNSYWNSTTAPIGSIGGGSPLATSQMQQQSSFTAWDFGSTWF